MRAWGTLRFPTPRSCAFRASPLPHVVPLKKKFLTSGNRYSIVWANATTGNQYEIVFPHSEPGLWCKPASKIFRIPPESSMLNGIFQVGIAGCVRYRDKA